MTKQRIRLVNLKLGDPADVEVYAGAACWEWLQKDEFKRLKEGYGINEKELYWTQGPIDSGALSITVDIWAEVDPETATLIKLSGLCQL